MHGPPEWRGSAPSNDYGQDDDEEAVHDDYDFGTAFKYDMKEVESNMDEEEESAR